MIDIKEGYEFFLLHSATSQASKHYISDWIEPITREINSTVDLGTLKSAVSPLEAASMFAVPA